MYKDISYNQAKDIIDNNKIILLDVRTEEEFITGHIINAINIPIDELEYRINELKNKQQIIIVYCKSGNRSKIACEILEHYEYEKIYNLGGVINWPYGLEI